MTPSKFKTLARISAAAGIIALSFYAKSSYAGDAPASGITRWGQLTVGQSDYYIPMPASYPIESADTQIGPDKKWMKVVWYPTGQNRSSWAEMMSLLILPANVPPIEVMRAQLKKSCPDSFIKIPAAAPQFVHKYDADAVQLGCGPDASSPMSLRGYYVAIRTRDYSYLLSRETRSTAFKTNTPLQAETLEEWRQTFEKFAVCQKGDFCAKLKAEDK